VRIPAVEVCGFDAIKKPRQNSQFCAARKKLTGDEMNITPFGKGYDRIVHTIIALENIPILWDIFVNHGVISWAKIAFLFTSIILLYGLWFIHYRAEKGAATAPVPTQINTLDLLSDQAKEIAKIRLKELADRANYLAGKVPMQDQNSERLFHFWAEEANNWGVVVQDVLTKHWGKGKLEQFTSLDGFNNQEQVGQVHKEVADAYRLLLFRQRSLTQVRANL
jgi:hypothetical protein